MISPQNMKTWQAKVVAISFIVMTLLGNFWVLRMVLGQDVPQWFFHLLVVAVLAVIFGGSSLMWRSYMDTELEGLSQMDADETHENNHRE